MGVQTSPAPVSDPCRRCAEEAQTARKLRPFLLNRFMNRPHTSISTDLRAAAAKGRAPSVGKGSRLAAPPVAGTAPRPGGRPAASAHQQQLVHVSAVEASWQDKTQTGLMLGWFWATCCSTRLGRAQLDQQARVMHCGGGQHCVRSHWTRPSGASSMPTNDVRDADIGNLP